MQHQLLLNIVAHTMARRLALEPVPTLTFGAFSDLLP